MTPEREAELREDWRETMGNDMHEALDAVAALRAGVASWEGLAKGANDCCAALREERDAIQEAAGNVAPREMLVAAVRQWKTERDDAIWWIRSACKEHPKLLPPSWVGRCGAPTRVESLEAEKASALAELERLRRVVLVTCGRLSPKAQAAWTMVGTLVSLLGNARSSRPVVIELPTPTHGVFCEIKGSCRVEGVGMNAVTLDETEGCFFVVVQEPDDGPLSWVPMCRYSG